MEKARPRLLQNTRRVNYEFARLAVGGRERVKMNAGGSRTPYLHVIRALDPTAPHTLGSPEYGLALLLGGKFIIDIT